MARTPRLLHAGAWWVWALALAAAASRTTNVLLLALIVGAAGLVVAARAGNTPWSGSFVAALKLGAVVIVIRLVFQLLFGADLGSTTLVTLPSLPLPDWAEGVRVGGTVTLESMVAGFYDGVRLAAMLACIGAANALTGPTRLLRSVPGSLYEMGVAIVIALSLAPQLVMDARRIREARRLRGRSTSGVRGLSTLLAPVLDGSLRRSLDLAAAMDARGYGRSTALAPRVRRSQNLMLIGGLVGVGIGVYGLLDGSSPTALGLPVLIVGCLIAIVGLRLSGRRAVRSRYQRDPWGLAETGVVICGAITAAGLWVVASTDPLVAYPSVTPLVWPSLSLLSVVVIAIGALPTVIAPPLAADDADDVPARVPSAHSARASTDAPSAATPAIEPAGSASAVAR